MKIDLLKIYESLLARYGAQHWWPGDSPWEICAGAVLTQNTNWNNVEKAVSNLKRSKNLSPSKIISMSDGELHEAIKPSGYFRVKTVRLREAAKWWIANVRNDTPYPRGKPLDYWRKSLLEVNGVGPETADSILLYSFNLPTFVVDAYTKRIMARHFGFPNHIEYHELRKYFMDNLPENAHIYNEFHALIVRTGKEACKKNICLDECPLRKF